MNITTSTILYFHIGRGGRFHNPGHKSFFGLDYITPTTILSEKAFLPTNDKDEPINGDATEYTDCNGNGLGFTVKDENEGVGTINWDNDYDSDVFKRIEDLDDEDFQAILSYAKDNKHWKDECYEILRTAGRWDLVPEDGKMYMHVDTGSVDTYENWVSNCYTYDEEGFETDKECVDHYIQENKLAEVVKDEDGNWKEV